MTPWRSYVMETTGVPQRQLHLTNGQHKVLVEPLLKISAVAAGKNKNGTTLAFFSIL